MNQPDAHPAARELLTLLGRLGLTLAVAESLTGGRVAAALTAVPGASAVFRGSFTAYATDLKAGVLDVDAALLAEVGAVHPEVARQMARGVRRLCGADVGISTTGVAGPQSQDGRPVGTVYAAVATRGDIAVEGFLFTGDRARIQWDSTDAVLRLSRDRLTMWTGI